MPDDDISPESGATPGPEPTDDDAARRARRREYLRAYRAARRAEGRCIQCGQPVPKARPGREPAAAAWCPACHEKKRATGRRNASDARARARAERESALRADLAAHGTPVCPKCGSANIGRVQKPLDPGRPFYCKDCRQNRQLTCRPRPGPIPYPCPYCRGACRSAGYSRAGFQVFRCRACGRRNTMLHRNPAVAAPAPGPLRRQVVFCLGPAAVKGLVAYCQAHRISNSAAIRGVLRPHARPMRPAVGGKRTNPWSSSDDDADDPFPAAPAAAAEPLRYRDTPLPNVARSSMLARWRAYHEQELLELPETALVVARVTVRLDDESWEGLHRLMLDLRMTHQEVVRHLLARLRV